MLRVVCENGVAQSTRVLLPDGADLGLQIPITRLRLDIEPGEAVRLHLETDLTPVDVSVEPAEVQTVQLSRAQVRALLRWQAHAEASHGLLDAGLEGGLAVRLRTLLQVWEASES